MHNHPQPEKIELTSKEFEKIESEVKACASDKCVLSTCFIDEIK